MPLLLFDIDGTLMLKASRDHALAIHAALLDVHGLAAIPEGRVEAAGRTDGAITRSILTLAGVSAERIDARMDAVKERACAEYARRCPGDLSEHVAPGMLDVLAELDARDDMTFALVTGNLECVARLKLARAGLAPWFASAPGGFGSDSDDRAELPEIARARAGGWPREDTVVIGDTPRDIACARADGVRVIAIATGPFGADALRDADAVVTSAREIPAALARLGALGDDAAA